VIDIIVLENEGATATGVRLYRARVA